MSILIGGGPGACEERTNQRGHAISCIRLPIGPGRLGWNEMHLIMLPFRAYIGILVLLTLLLFTGVATSFKRSEPAAASSSTMGHSFMTRLLKSLSHTFIGRPKSGPASSVDSLMSGRVFSKRSDFMDFAKMRSSNDRHMVTEVLSKLIEYAPFNLPFYLQRYMKELSLGTGEAIFTGPAEKGTTDASATLLKVSGMINILFLVGALFIA